MTNLHEPRRQDVQQEAPDELDCLQRHGLVLIAVSGVAPSERDLTVVQRQQAIAGDGHSVRIAGEVLQDVLRSAERWLSVDDPLCRLGVPKPRMESSRFGKIG